jgi:hypothetical protein
MNADIFTRTGSDKKSRLIFPFIPFIPFACFIAVASLFQIRSPALIRG